MCCWGYEDAPAWYCCALPQVMAVLSSAAMVAGPALFDPSSSAPHVVGVLLQVLGGSPRNDGRAWLALIVSDGSAHVACLCHVAVSSTRGGMPARILHGCFIWCKPWVDTARVCACV